jgi:signal peptidase I
VSEVAETLPSTQESGSQEPARAKSTVREYAESLLITLVLALFGTTFLVQAFKIPSQSMESTLLVGDHLLVNKFIFGGRGAWYERLLPYREVRRGDIIVFKFPYDDHPHYVKRVIGIPGDRIRIVEGAVYVNGQRSTEPYVARDPGAEDPFGDDFPPTDRLYLQRGIRPEWAADIANHIQNGELVVPPNHYFAMGDNRDHSWDSRYWGFVDREAIMGRPVVIYWSVAATSDDYATRSLSSSFAALLDTLLHFPSRTRWRRLFHEVH